MKSLNFSPVALAVACAISMPVIAQDFSGLGSLGGGNTLVFGGLSADGSTVVGQSSDPLGTSRAFRWTRASGMFDLGSLDGPGGQSYATGVSADGSVVVGGSRFGARDAAFRWTAAGGMQDIGSLAGGDTYAYAVSGNGAVVVGESEPVGGGLGNAFRWTGGVMTDLGRLPGDNFSEALATSFDGSVVVGTSYSFGAIARAFKWTAPTAMVALGGLPGGQGSQGRGVSADGSVVVGYADNAASQTRAVRWTQVGPTHVIQDLGLLPGSVAADNSYAFGVSGDGRVVVGQASQGGNAVAFRWTEATQMQSVAAWLAAAGVATGSWLLEGATSTNADGSVVVGQGTNPAGAIDSWIARVAPPGSPHRPGIMSPNNYMRSAVALRQATQQSSEHLSRLIMWGGHHRPLMSYGDIKQRGCFWATGDLSHRGNDPDTKETLAETGICGDFADGKVRAGVGIGYGKQTLDLGQFGSSRMAGNHVVAELNVQPVDGLILSATAVHGRWTLDARRGYAGGAGTDFSNGRARVESTALRLRADWDKLWTVGNTPLSPYAAATLTHTRTDGYTETGGGFPARFDAQTHTGLESRIGVAASHALLPSTTLRPTAEVVHRLDRDGPRVSGQVLGLFAFDQAGTAQRRTWARLGADIDHEINNSTLLSFSLHTASRGEDPRVSAAVSLRMSF